jgi:predicted Zn-dependent protease
MLTKQQAKKICDKVLGFSKAAQTEVILTDTDSALTRFAKNTIIQNVSTKGIDLSARVTAGKCVGRASTNCLDDASLKAMVQQAIAQAKAERPGAEIPPMVGPQKYQKVDNFREATAALTPEARADAVAYIAGKCRAANVECAGAHSSSTGVMVLANSKGMFAYDLGTNAEFSVTVLTADSAGWAEGANRDCAKIDTQKLSDTAFDKAVKSRNPQPIAAGEYTVVLEPAGVTDFLMYMARGFSAQAMQDGTSFLTGRLGTKVLGENITITDDAYNPEITGLPFDFEGTPRQSLVLMEKGVPKNLVYDLKSAKKDKTKSTGHALPQPNTIGGYPTNLIVDAGNSSLEEMIKTTKKGLLVTHFHYTNLAERREVVLTGMTRDGLFMIENGEVAHPVTNMRFTESTLRALSNVELISRDRIFAQAFFGGGFLVPAMKINKFNFSSETKF